MIQQLPLTWRYRDSLRGQPTLALSKPVAIMGYIVPTGTRTDGATLPWFVRAFLSPYGDYLPAALLHDWLLRQPEYTRRECAHAFKRALKHQGMPDWLTNLFFAGVRLNDHWQALRSK